MNSKQSRALMQKHTKYDYETRFLLQSKKNSPNRKRSPQLLGGEDVLDFVCICFAERIADDNVLRQVYGDLNTKALVQVQKELLLFALDDGFSALTQQQVCKRGILQRHVRLGLMEREEYFDRLAHHLYDALTACQIGDLHAVFRTQRRFEATRPLLEVTREYVQLQSQRSQKMESIGLPFLGHFFGKKLTNNKERIFA